MNKMNFPQNEPFRTHSSNLSEQEEQRIEQAFKKMKDEEKEKANAKTSEKTQWIKDTK